MNARAFDQVYRKKELAAVSTEHLDADVVESAESPGHRYPSRGGPSVALLERVMTRIAATGRVIAVSVSSWDPELDTDGRSREVTMRLVDRVLGRP